MQTPFVCTEHSTQHATKFRYETHLTMIPLFQWHISFVYHLQKCSAIHNKRHPVSRVSKITYYLRQPINLASLAVTLRTARFNIQNLYMVLTLRLCVQYVHQNKQRLLPDTTVNKLVLYNGRGECLLRGTQWVISDRRFVCKGLTVLRTKFWSCQLTTGFGDENITAEITWLPSEMWWTEVEKHIVTRFARNYSKNRTEKIRKSFRKITVTGILNSYLATVRKMKLLLAPNKGVGEWRRNHTNSEALHHLEASGHLHAQGRFIPLSHGKEPSAPTEYDAKWAPEPVWTLGKEISYFRHELNQNSSLIQTVVQPI